MNQPEFNDDILSSQRLAQPSHGLQERVLRAARDAWAEAEPAGEKFLRTRPEPERSSWWQFAAAAALLLLTSLNAIQSAGNLEAAGRSKPLSATQMTDVDAQRLAGGFDGLKASDVKRLAGLSSLR